MSDSMPRPSMDVYKFVTEMRASDKKIDAEIAPQDKSFSSLAGLDEWKVLKGYIELRIKNLRSLLGYETANKSLDDIGLRFLVADLASAELENIISKVEDGQRAVREIEKEREERTI